MKTYFLIEQHDWWGETYANLARCYGAERLVLSGSAHANRKWQRVLRLLALEAKQTEPILRAILGTSEPVMLVCTTAHYAALLAGRMAGLLGKQPQIYLVNFYLHDLGQRKLVRDILTQLLTRRVGILVQSPNEVAFYRAVAPQAAISYYPLGLGNPDDPPPPCASEPYVFAGGFTNRDYDTLLRVARKLTAIRFVIVRSAANQISEPVPENVEMLMDLPENEFRAVLCASKLVVLPLKDDVGSSGQMVALAAMQMGKLVIYADYPVVSQYFQDGFSGLAYRPGDERDLQDKVEAAMQDEALTAQIGAQARHEWEQRFIRRCYEEALIDGVDRFVGGTGRS